MWLHGRKLGHWRYILGGYIGLPAPSWLSLIRGCLALPCGVMWASPPHALNQWLTDNQLPSLKHEPNETCPPWKLLYKCFLVGTWHTQYGNWGDSEDGNIGSDLGQYGDRAQWILVHGRCRNQANGWLNDIWSGCIKKLELWSETKAKETRNAGKQALTLP